MASETQYHNLGTYSLGDDQWDHTDTVELVEANVPKEDPLADRPTDAPTGRLFWATDARLLFRYDPNHDLAGPDGWVVIGGLGSSTDPIPGTAHFSNLTVGGQVTSDLDVAGELTENGEAIATERSTKTIDVLDHGDPTNADAALTDAVAAAEPYDTLLFRDNTFVFTENHTLSKPVSFRFENAEVDDQRSNITVGASLFRWDGPGVQASDVLQADVGVGNHTVSVGTASWASVGDVIYIEDTTGTEPITQFAVVDSVNDPGDGTQDITVEGVIRRDFSANADVHIVEQWDRIRVEGAEIVATHGDGELFAFNQCHRPRVEDVLAHQIGRHTVQFAECYDPIAENCEARNAIKKGSGEGEPFICFRCTDVTFANCRTQNTRRGVDITLGTTGATIREPHIEDYTKGGVSAHDGDEIRDVTIIGGEISSTDPSDGPCISMGGATENITIHGTSIVAHRRAILITGPADISGVDITLAELPSSSPELVSVNGSDVSISGRIHIPTYTDYVRAVDIEGGNAVSNVDLNLDISVASYAAAGNEDPLVNIGAGASDIRLRGDIESLGDFSTPAVRLYGMASMIENVEADVNIRGHGHQGIQARGDAGVRGLHVTDSLIDVDGDCIRFYQYDTGTTIEEVWIRDCTLRSTNGTGLDAGGMAADSVWFLDNVGSMANIGSVTNLHSERAELDKDETVTGAWSFNQAITGDITGDAGTVDGYEGADLAALAEAETVTADWTFGAGLTLGGDLTDDAGNLVFDYTNNVIPAAILAEDYGDLATAETVTGVWDFSNGVTSGGNDVLTTADESVVTSGTVQLSSGSAVIDTGLASATVDVALDPTGGGQNTADVKAAARTFFDSAAGTVKVEILEDGTGVGNPYIGYTITER